MIPHPFTYVALLGFLRLHCLNDRAHSVSLLSQQRCPCTNVRISHLYTSQSSEERDLWNSKGLNNEWKSSLPLPENALDPLSADRARIAMSGTLPSALQGRYNINTKSFRVDWQHVDPPVLTIDNFLTQQESDELLKLQNVSPPPGSGRVIKMESRVSDSNKERSADTAVRSSTTWYVRYGAPAVVPLLRALLELLPDVTLEQCEEVQLVRYEGGGQGFGWHEDILGMNEATPEAGGQRKATLLVYLNDCENGRTLFRDLRGKDNQRLGVSPKTGRALLFFPSVTWCTELYDDPAMSDAPRKTFGDTYFDDTKADHRTSHAGEPPGNNDHKNIAQIWIHSQAHTPRVFGRGLNKHHEAGL